MSDTRPVLVDTVIPARIANEMHGGAYGEDWIWHDDEIGLLHPQAAIDSIARDLAERDAQAQTAMAAIHYALKEDEGMAFLRMWREGEFDAIRREWPDAPDTVFSGAEAKTRAGHQEALHD